MIIADPITNTPNSTPTVSPAASSGGSPAPGRDAAGTQGAGAQGCAERTRVSMYAMAVEGLDFMAGMAIDAPGKAIAVSGLALVLKSGITVWQWVNHNGPEMVTSLDRAYALRMLLGYASGRFDGIEHDTLARDGVSLLHIAEIRMGIRTRNGDLRREWN
jgi:hypothetical protein